AVSARDRVRRAPQPVAAPCGASGAARLRGRGVLGGGGAGGAGERAATGLASAVGWGGRHSRAAPAAARLSDDSHAPGNLTGPLPGMPVNLQMDWRAGACRPGRARPAHGLGVAEPSLGRLPGAPDRIASPGMRALRPRRPRRLPGATLV